MMTGNIAESAPAVLRPAKSEDQAFFFHLYSVLKIESLGGWDWEASQKDSIMKLQFRDHERSVQNRFPKAQNHVVTWDGRSAGRVILIKGRENHHLADMALLPEYRSRGIGSTLVSMLQQECERRSLPLTLKVYRYHRAVRFYMRLGFRICDQNNLDYDMVWEPSHIPTLRAV